MLYAGKESQSLGDVVPILTDLGTRNSRVNFKKLSKAYWLCEKIGCMASRRFLNHDCLLKLHDEFIPEQVHLSRTIQ